MPSDPFLPEILADPDDVTRRLVYADWLEEQGDPARAEFIRVQCRLADLPEDDPARDDLEQRERELLAAHERGWLGPDWPAQAEEWMFRRGFVEDIVWAPEDRLPVRENRRFGVVFENNPVQRVEIRSHHGGRLLFSPDFERCHYLDLLGGILGEGDLRELVSPPRLRHLRGLNLTANWLFAEAGRILGRESALEALRELNLANGSDPPDMQCNQLTDRGVEGLTAQPPFDRLESLNLDGNQLSIDSVYALIDAPFAPHLTALSLAHNDLAPEGVDLIASSACFAGLRRLTLDRTGADLEALENLVNSDHVRDLERISLSEAIFEDEAAEILVGSRAWPKLEVLRLVASKLGPDACYTLAHAPTGPRHLDLSENPVLSAGIQHLARAGWLPRLAWLGLVDTALEDDALFALAGAPGACNLRNLQLNNNPQVTDAGAIALAASPFLNRLAVLNLNFAPVGDPALAALLSSATLARLTGLGLRGSMVTPAGVRALAATPALARLSWLDLSNVAALDGSALAPLAESRFLSPLLELQVHAVALDPEVRRRLRERLGVRFSE